MPQKALAIPTRIESEWSGTTTACDGHVLWAVSPKAFPPGQPVELVLLLDDGELELATRAIGSKKRDDGHFELRVRLVNLRKQARERLDTLFSIQRG
ncbi:MAG TPA: hypothetical protein VF331_14340 [Polyangiales bacterium]